jgi:excisionase family DNA binding protein
MSPQEERELLTPAEVATLFGVDQKTVGRWTKAGKLTAIRTVSGHRRYLAAEVRALRGPGGSAHNPNEVHRSG